MTAAGDDAERDRLAEDARRVHNWRRWGPYLAERQWGTVREDYSATGECWSYLPHDHARSRVYRWGEDGLLGICDRECRVCFSIALWNGRDHPYHLQIDHTEYEVHYAPGESDSGLFGGNSNWRGPVWFPVNYLIIEGLKRYHHFYGATFTVECPTGSGVRMTLGEVAEELERRLVSLVMPDARGRRPCHGDSARYTDDPAFRDLVLFYEYFHGDDGRGLGASHQTGWTALAGNLIERVASTRRVK